ncbi:hypothetical protein VTI74DRAFT_10988 [Chaetomium olivicolor]
MAAQYDSGLEPARQDFPEVSHGQHAYGLQPLYYHQPYDPSKPGAAAPPSTYGGQTVSSPYSFHAEPLPPRSSTARTICGCSLLVFILSCIIGVLSAAVIGLAAATGVEVQRANNAASSLAALNASTTATGTAPGATSTAVIDDGCATDPTRVTGTLYTSFSLLGGLKFTRHCNKDAPHPPILSLFVADFATCMDACAAYTKYVPTNFADTGLNATCEAVSFIPAWTNKTTASAGGAPGNCYLKSGPQNATGLTTPNIGVACHAAVLTPGA